MQGEVVVRKKFLRKQLLQFTAKVRQQRPHIIRIEARFYQQAPPVLQANFNHSAAARNPFHGRCRHSLFDKPGCLGLPESLLPDKKLRGTGSPLPAKPRYTLPALTLLCQ